MKSKWSSNWGRSKQPRKQRKFRANAPLHIKHKFLSAHLSEDLRKKHNKRSMPLRKKDKVKVLRGKFKGKIGEVEEVSLKRTRIFVKGVEIKKDEGRAIKFPVQPSNVVILELNLDDKRRKAVLERTPKKETTQAKKSAKKKEVKR